VIHGPRTNRKVLKKTTLRLCYDCWYAVRDKNERIPYKNVDNF